MGTYKVNETLNDIIVEALDCGYRHIDAASIYGNEEAIGKSLINYLNTHNDLKREDLFIVSKVW